MRKQEKKNEELKYVVNRIIAECHKNNYHTIGMSTSMEKNPQMKELVELCKERMEEKKLSVQIKELQSICYYADALEEARSCDAVVLVERYLYTTYKGMDKAMELLGNAEIRLLGVVNVR